MIHDEVTCARRRSTIRDLNDQLRTKGIGGKVMLTRAMAAHPPQTLSAVLSAVREFDDFTSANDPWSKHDFGSVVVEGETYFFKIDAYDLNLEYGSPDPSDDSITRRVLTIMQAGDL